MILEDFSKEEKKKLLEILQLETFEVRNRDILDFHDLAVWQIVEALEFAYNLGYVTGEYNK